MLAETLITCLEALAVTQAGGGFLYYFIKRDSTRATILELRGRGLTIDQLAHSFDLNRNTIVKILREAYDTSDIKLDTKSDWLDRYEAWCQTNDKHVEEKSLKCGCSECRVGDMVPVEQEQGIRIFTATIHHTDNTSSTSSYCESFVYGGGSSDDF